ncbi:GNAT family N-acetyltransferase [Candidatus Babeliales bacterium]|nr:GNAT family N-acetyltransferase [Candidatus Babeliales bacterium]
MIKSTAKRYLLATFAASFLLFSFAQPEISLDWIVDADDPRLEEAWKLHIHSFTQAYKEAYPGEKIDGGAFIEFKKELAEQKGDFFFVIAEENGKVIAYASFKRELEDTIYGEQMAVTPIAWKQGIAQKLMDAIKEKIQKDLPKVKKAILITRRKNIPAIKLYKKNDFIETSYVHEGYDPEKFIGLEKTLD